MRKVKLKERNFSDTSRHDLNWRTESGKNSPEGESELVGTTERTRPREFGVGLNQ